MKNLLWLKSAFVISLLLIYNEIPNWALLASLIMFLWKIFLDSYNWEPPSKIMTGILAVAVLIFSRMHFGSFLGRENAATLFLVLGALKLLEVSNLRDRQFCRFLILGALSVKFLFAIELWVFVPALIGTFLIFIDLRNSNTKNLKKESQLVLKIWAYAIPLTVFFFFVFPRFQSPFGTSQSKSITGFAPSLGPGSVTQLMLSREPVMRVNYRSQKTDDGYWVGDYLYSSKGLSWEKGSDLDFETQKILPEKYFGQQPDYVVTLEPHQFSTLFSVANTEALQIQNENVFKVSDGVFLTDHPILERVQYSGFLARKFTESRGKMDESRLLQHPEISIELKNNFEFIKKNKNWSRKKIVNELIQWIKEKDFKYSLNPGNDSKNIEDFLLKGKKGFCEHYAAAFATVLRYLNVPTRAAVGYQGGEWNDVGSYLLVTQQDAHAWIEFVNDQGAFEKLDLVSFLAPDRLIFGARDFAERFDSNTGKVLAKSGDLVSALLYFKNSILLWVDSINYLWIKFLIDFNIEKQKEILSGLKDLWPIFLLTLILIVGGYSILKQARLQQTADHSSEALKALIKHAVEKKWMSENSFEGPMKLKQVYNQKLKSDSASRIFDSYINEKYFGGPKANDKLLKKDLKTVVVELNSLKN